MIKGINIFLPTRGRPQRLRKFLDSMYAQASNVDRLHIVFVVDKDDTPTLDYINDAVRDLVSHDLLINSLEYPHLARFYNRCYDQTSHSSDEWAVSMFGDDMVFVTPGWDQTFIDELNRHDGKAIVHGDDDYLQHGRLPVHFVTSRPLVRATKRPFMCPLFAADMIDTVWGDVGKKTKLLHYLPNVHIRHEHNGRLLSKHRDETWQRLQRVKMSRVAAYLRVGKESSAIVKNLTEAGYVG